MRRLVLALVLGAGACAAPAPAPSDPSADRAAIEAVLDGWYTAMIAKDSAGTVAPLTEEFLLLEDTLPLSRAELAARILQGEGQWTSKRHDFQTRVAGDVAWSTFRNDETSQGPDGASCAARFLETAVFIRRGGGWLIDRYHAAAVERWHCGPPAASP
jgi:ketosteroid isomerase-like protein